MYEIKLSNKIIGVLQEERVFISRIINLSSATDEFVEMRLMSILDQKKAINKFPIIPNLMMSEITGKLESKDRMKKTGMVFIVDEDDKYKDIKIRNICIVNNCFMIGRVVMQYENSNKYNREKFGLIIRLATKQISNELCQRIGIARMPKNKKCAKVTLIQFQSKLFGSIAGLTQMANYFSLPFDIEVRQITDNPTWLLMPEKMLKNIRITDTIELPDDDDKLDKDWNRKCYYTDKVTTERSMRKIAIVDRHGKEHKMNTNDIVNTIKIIIKLIKRFIYGVIKIYNRITEKINNKVNEIKQILEL